MLKVRFKPAQSLQRGLRLLEAVSESREGVSLKDLAARIECSQAAAFHLVHTLADAGYVKRLESPPRFVLGEKLMGLAERQRGDAFSTRAHDTMRMLAAETPGAAVYLSEHIGGSIVVTASLDVPSRGDLIREEKNRILPPYASAGALAHFAFWEEEVREEFSTRYPFEGYGLPYWKSRAKFDAAVRALRDKKIFRMPEPSERVLKFAVPLFFPGGGIAAALTLQLNLKSDAGIERHEKHLTAAALAAAAHFSKTPEP